jgi:hypothetical protein
MSLMVLLGLCRELEVWESLLTGYKLEFLKLWARFGWIVW